MESGDVHVVIPERVVAARRACRRPAESAIPGNRDGERLPVRARAAAVEQDLLRAGGGIEPELDGPRVITLQGDLRRRRRVARAAVEARGRVDGVGADQARSAVRIGAEICSWV